MLACSVSLRARRTVAAILAEAGAAADAVNTLGLGQLVEESTSAGDTVNAGHISLAAIAEPAGAIDAPSATVAAAGVFAGTVAEAATADSAQDAAAVSGALARSAMADMVFVNSDGTVREASVDVIMVNL